MSAEREIRSVETLEVGGKHVFLRADLNVPLRDGRITDDSRVRESLQTLNHLRERGARVVLASHLGRPKGQRVADLTLEPVAQVLRIPLAPDVVGPAVAEQVGRLRDGDAILLENLRFHPGEEQNAPELVEGLAELAGLYVNDAFGTAHRAHASTVGLAHALAKRGGAAAGFLLLREVEALTYVRDGAERPFVCILGGAKVSDKLSVLEALVERADTIAIGGAMAYTFLMARGEPVGRSRVEPDQVERARRLLGGPAEIVLPVDHVVAPDPDRAGEARIAERIPDDQMGLDIGPRTIEEFAARLVDAATVFWNGPLGLFEREAFARGSREIAIALAKSAAYSVVGGGDSLAAVHAAGVESRIRHLSTGGGASLEFVEGRTLPGIEALRSTP